MVWFSLGRRPSGTLTGYDVHYTSAPATGTGMVSNTAAASGSNPATAWVADSRGTESSPPTAQHQITGLNNGTAYRVRVRAKNSNGAGTWVFGTGTPEVATPFEPVNLAVTADHTTLSLSWNRNSGGGPPASYAVHYTALGHGGPGRRCRHQPGHPLGEHGLQRLDDLVHDHRPDERPGLPAAGERHERGRHQPLVNSHQRHAPGSHGVALG